LGEVRIGLALSDPLGITAQPLESLRPAGPRKAIDAIVRVAREHEVHTVLVGLPLLLSGEEGTQATHARAVAEQLGKRLSGVRVVLWDERLTTVQAERTLIEAGMRRKKRKRTVDSLAALLILQSYLDAPATSDADDA
jgi:putative Holliday junction resolvase